MNHKLKFPIRISSIITLGLACYTIICLSGCATLFSKKRGKVCIHTTTPNAVIYHNGDSVGIDNACIIAKKNKLFETITVHKEGYKDKNFVFGMTKREASTYALYFMDIPTFFGPLIQAGPALQIRFKKFDDNQVIEAQTPYVFRKPEEKYIHVKKVALDAPKEQVSQLNYPNYKMYLKSLDSNNIDKRFMHKITKRAQKVDSGLNAESEYLTNWLNESLLRLNFMDTTVNIFKNKEGITILTATVKKLKIHEVTFANTRRYLILPRASAYVNSYSRMLVLETGIDWQIMNAYEEPILTLHTDQKSDPFQFDVLIDPYKSYRYKRGKKDAISAAMADNLDYSFLKVRNMLAQQQLLNRNQKSIDTLTPMDIPVGNRNQSNRLNDFIKSSVTVKVDEGHGSGVIISSEGYIVTNYHVVANSKKIEVILNDGSTIEATVVRKNQEGDLALLKVNNTGLIALNIGTEKDIQVGADVCALGTPKNIALGQSVTKGIISNIRKTENIHLIQTDAKVSPGNSGGALINNNGLVLGIVSSKLIGKGTEGISFAIFASDMLRLLKINLIK